MASSTSISILFTNIVRCPSFTASQPLSMLWGFWGGGRTIRKYQAATQDSGLHRYRAKMREHTKQLTTHARGKSLTRADGSELSKN